jgi:hypothetical protein
MFAGAGKDLMTQAKIFPALMLCSASFSLYGYQSPAQHKPARPEYVPASRPASGTEPQEARPEIHVDERCRILPRIQPDLSQPGATSGTNKPKPPRPRKDSVVCHLESVLSSSHVEETVVAGVTLRSNVNIEEQEYILQDVTPDPVTFVVEQPLRKDWQVDSDPQPVETVGSVAFFRVNAVPGEIVRLHVGLRHAKTKQKK